MDGARATRALVVDDERMNREVVVANLRAGGYETVTAEDGQQAWEVLDRLPGEFDVILLDRQMPRMGGMELLTRLKADARLRHIPVIMQTARSSVEDVAEGIKAGVYYYLPKPLDRKLLLSVTSAAVEDHLRFRRLAEDMEKRSSALALMDRGEFRFRTVDEANRLAVALARVCPQAQFLAVGLAEVFTNAVEHGNLGITFEEKAALIAEKRLAKEIEARLDAPQYRDKSVTVHFERGPGEVRFTVRDEGAGFDWRKFVDLDASRAFAAHGRGIVMAKRLSFDDMEYRDPGNEVTCVIRGKADATPAPATAAVPAAAPPPPATAATPLRRRTSDEELATARAMQLDLLPAIPALEALPADITAHFETSQELGGDLWGVLPLDEHHFGLWLADFAGHGITAALNAFRLHALIPQVADPDRPAAFMADLNRRLAGLLKVGQYATMIYGVVDLEAEEFRYAAAAAPQPLAVGVEGLNIQLGDGSGLPLGVSRSSSYAERRLAMPPGTVLFLASDALAEARIDGEALGASGVLDLLRRAVAAHRAEVRVDSILAPFLATVQRPLADDLTAVCCRV